MGGASLHFLDDTLELAVADDDLVASPVRLADQQNDAGDEVLEDVLESEAEWPSAIDPIPSSDRIPAGSMLGNSSLRANIPARKMLVATAIGPSRRPRSVRL
jgi:hypothetical protein